jgi:hypothetical protein
MQVARQGMFRITPPIKKEIEKIVDARIKEAHVRKEDFSELKNIVKDLGVKTGELAAAQMRTEIKVEELAEAQKRTEIKVEALTVSQRELVEAQKRTETAITRLTESVEKMSKEIGGLGKSFGYHLENESYRFLPEILKRKFGLEIKEKIIRVEIGGKEINVFCHAIKEGREVLVVGEAKTKLDVRKEHPEVFEELEGKVRAVVAEYPQAEIVKVLVTHFADNSFLDKAKARSIIVVQSFEW